MVELVALLPQPLELKEVILFLEVLLPREEVKEFLILDLLAAMVEVVVVDL
jgi:hypothetical protein